MDDDQQFCLRWNNHQSTLVAVFDTLLENGTLVDCTLAAEGKCLNAHKVVLSACSPYFESLLSKHFDKHPILILKDVKFQELKAMMDYMYRGEVNISQDQLGALLKAAESLQIKGLSDNRKGETERKPAPTSLPPKSPQPASAIPKVQGLTIEQRSRDDSREGSMSPGPRKKKRLRRKSEDLDNHDASNSSESHSLPAQNIPSSLPAVSKMNADVPEPVETKSEILTRHKQPDELPQVPIIKEKLETHTELMLEPKSEYVEEMNEDSIEDLTLDDDDLSNMDQVDEQAGPSHGNAGEGSSQGFGGWHMGNQSQDEVFLAAQEAVGAHRDSQGFALLYKDQVRRLIQFHGLEPFAEPEVIIQTGSRKLSNITATKRSATTKKNSKSRKSSQAKQPRVSTYEHKTGKIFKIFRCLTCPSFVKKNQPHCFTCMGVPHLGQKKVAALKRAGLEQSIPQKQPATAKKSTTVVKPKKSLKRKRKPGSRIPCSSCHRRTKCRDGICMICKTKNEASTSTKTAEDDDNKAPSKSVITNIQSVVIKPARQSAKAISNGTPSNPYHRFSTRSTRSSRSRRSDENESNEIFIPESAAEVEPLPLNSDAENPLEQSHDEETVHEENPEDFFVTMSDIHSILSEHQI